MKTVLAVAAVIRDGDRVFAAQRGHGAQKGGWEFPGGKIEAGETPQQALVREIREELDTAVTVGDYLTTMDVLLEHEAARWLRADELDSVAWLPADLTIIPLVKEKLK